jgi:hypothetical protein
LRLRVPFGGGFRRARLNGRRVRTDCVQCCSDSPWYIKGIACVYGTLSGACAEAARPDIWICVNATTSNGQTVRERYGSSASATFTVLYNGACYRATYRPLDDSGLTATETQAIASGLERIACDEVVNDTPVDCNDERCPRGLGFVEATLCRPGEGANPPRVFVCSAAITEACTFNYAGFCYCIKPGIGVGIGSIPADAIIFYTSPCTTVDGVHRQRTCCQCLAGCTWAPLRGDYSRICCCGEMTLVAYAASWRVRRTLTNAAGTSYEEVIGNATRGTPDANGDLPATFTFVSVAADGSILENRTEDALLRVPGGIDLCGFNSNDPPPTWCIYGSCTDDPQYNLPQNTGMRYLVPAFVDEPNRTGMQTGVSNASCNSIAMRQSGVTTYTYSDGVEVIDADYSINFTWNRVVPEECRGDCLDVGSPVYIVKPIVEGLADPRSLLP